MSTPPVRSVYGAGSFLPERPVSGPTCFVTGNPVPPAASDAAVMIDCGDGAIALPATWSPCACVFTTYLTPDADQPAMSRLSSGTARVENPVSITTAPSAPEKTTMLFIMPQGNATRRIEGATSAMSNVRGVNRAPRCSSHATSSV